MKNILLMLLAFTSVVYSQQRYDFEMDSLHVAWGEKNYSGPDDCSASVKLFSDGEFINIHVEVTDDVLVFNDDPINSDHVELWFALPSIPTGQYSGISNSKFVVGDSLLYLINGKPDLNRFKLFLEDPLINVRWAGPDSFYYSELNEADIGLPYIKESVDEFMEEVSSSNYNVQNTFLGMVHYGILPNHNTPIQYDLENYQTIEKFTGIGIDSTSKYISYSQYFTSNGYSFDIKIPAEGLGFISKFGLTNFRFLVDIIDVDSTGKQESLLSISKERTWGDPKSFIFEQFRLPIKVALNESISFLGTMPRKNPLHTKVLKRYSNIFIKTSGGWEPIIVDKKHFEKIDQPTVFHMDNLEVFGLRSLDIDYRQELIKNIKLEYLNTCDGEYLIIDDQKLLSTRHILKSLLLPSGEPAFLYTKYSISGYFGSQISSYLYLISSEVEERIAEFYDSYSDPFLKINDKKRVQKKWNYYKLDWNMDENNIDWSNVIVHKENEPHLILDLGNDVKYQINWNEDGKIISANEIE
jgi:hypothetical protein